VLSSTAVIEWNFNHISPVDARQLRFSGSSLGAQLFRFAERAGQKIDLQGLLANLGVQGL
jgi:hypothetical protein